MKKYIVILFLFLFSCQKDYIEDISSAPMFFDKNTQEITGDVTIDFILSEDGIHYLLLVDTSGRLLAREKFIGIQGINSRKLYVDILEQEEIYLMLYNFNNNKLKEVLIKLSK
tara:strand:- start:341 stop:679 length:339 start_codon:yes stop_codon:yes gene_type:complete